MPPRLLLVDHGIVVWEGGSGDLPIHQFFVSTLNCVVEREWVHCEEAFLLLLQIVVQLERLFE